MAAEANEAATVNGPGRRQVVEVTVGSHAIVSVEIVL